MAAPRVEIRYCARCRFMLRAAHLPQDLLTIFEKEPGGMKNFLPDRIAAERNIGHA